MNHTLHLKTWLGGSLVADTTHNILGDALSGTYDPATDRYLIASVDTSQWLRVSTTTSPGNIQVNGSGIGIPTLAIAIGGVAVACAPTSVVGTDNCIVVFAGPGSAYRSNQEAWGNMLHWFVGHVDAANDRFVVNMDSFHYNGYYVLGVPAVAYTGSSSTPWAVVFHQGGYYTFTLRKGPGLAENWAYTSFYLLSPGPSPWARPSPVLASWYRWTKYGTYRYLKQAGIALGI